MRIDFFITSMLQYNQDLVSDLNNRFDSSKQKSSADYLAPLISYQVFATKIGSEIKFRAVKADARPI